VALPYTVGEILYNRQQRAAVIESAAAPSMGVHAIAGNSLRPCPRRDRASSPTTHRQCGRPVFALTFATLLSAAAIALSGRAPRATARSVAWLCPPVDEP